MTNPDGFEKLNTSERRVFGHRKRRAEEIGEEAAKRFDDPREAKTWADTHIQNEFGSIVGTILIGLLCKVAVEVIWRILKKRFPDTFAGSCPPELLAGYESR